MREIVYRPKALAKIEEIADYTIAEWGQTQAKQYVADLRRKIELVAEFPGMGNDALGLPVEYRKARSGSHRAIYRYSDTELIVVRIVHEREDVPDDIEDFW